MSNINAERIELAGGCAIIFHKGVNGDWWAEVLLPDGTCVQKTSQEGARAALLDHIAGQAAEIERLTKERDSFAERTPAQASPGDAPIGWLYENPDTGTEFSESHPVESGEVDDAENIRPATAATLLTELQAAWARWAEERNRVQTPAPAAAPASQHDLYKTGDIDAPEVIKDRNGEVALELCKRCGKAEIELSGPCTPALNPTGEA